MGTIKWAVNMAWHMEKERVLLLVEIKVGSNIYESLSSLAKDNVILL